MRSEEEVRGRFFKAKEFSQSHSYDECKNDFQVRELIRVRAEKYILEWVLNDKEQEGE